jgi:MscS family membrane protein
MISYTTLSLHVLFGALLIAMVTRIFLRFVVKYFVKKTKTEFDDKILKIINRPIFWTIILTGIYFFLRPVSTNSIYLEILQDTIVSLVVLVWSWEFIQIAKVVFDEIEVKHGKYSDVVPFLNNITRFVVFLLAFFVLLEVWGVNIGPLIASAGIAGLGIAFAARETISNFFGGMSIFFDKPYKIGDYVIIEDKHRGAVIDIGMRSTKIRTRDNVLITVPNSTMITNAVINETGFDPRLRIRLPLQVSYKTNLEQAEAVIIQTLKNNKNVLKEPEPVVRYRSFDDSGITMETLFSIDEPRRKGEIVHSVIKDVFKNLNKDGISIPFPQRDVHLHEQRGR